MSQITKEEIRRMAEHGEEVSQLDVSHIENFSNIFYKIENFDQDISNWDVSNSKNFLRCYKGVANLKVIPPDGIALIVRILKRCFTIQTCQKWRSKNVFSQGNKK